MKADVLDFSMDNDDRDVALSGAISQIEKNFGKVSVLSGINEGDFVISEGVSKVRDKAKVLTKKRMQHFINSKLGMLIDGTGKDYNKISKYKKRLEAEGYDCYMVFVNTALDFQLHHYV